MAIGTYNSIYNYTRAHLAGCLQGVFFVARDFVEGEGVGGINLT